MPSGAIIVHNFNITDLTKDEVIVDGKVDEVQYQLQQMVNNVIATPGGQLYGTLALYNPNIQQIQHVTVNVQGGPTNPVGFMYGTTMNFQTMTESHLAHDVIIDAMSGFYIDTIEATQHEVLFGYDESQQTIFQLTGGN